MQILKICLYLSPEGGLAQLLERLHGIRGHQFDLGILHPGFLQAVGDSLFYLYKPVALWKRNGCFGKTLGELAEVAASFGMPRFTATQIAAWIYRKGALSIDEMTNISLKKTAGRSKRDIK